MSRRSDPGRRRFLLTLGAVGGAAALGGGVAGKRAWDHLLGAHLAEVLGDLEAARTIGRTWLALNAVQGRHADLVQSLLSDLGFPARLADRDELRRLVAERVRSDYGEGRIAQVDGWILSLTEVRLCALAAVSAPARPVALSKPREPHRRSPR